MSDCVINGVAVNEIYPINGCIGAVPVPPIYEPVGCYYLVAPECREYNINNECRTYYINSECKSYMVPSCGCDPS